LVTVFDRDLPKTHNSQTSAPGHHGCRGAINRQPFLPAAPAVQPHLLNWSQISLEQDDFTTKLTRVCRRAFGGSGPVEELKRLSGGANMESWALRYGDTAMVLRRFPGGGDGFGEDEEYLDSISLSAQADLIDAASRAGVTAPAILARLAPDDGLGEGFLMARAGGEAMPHKILGNPEYAAVVPGLTEQMARELARIHALPTSACADLVYASPRQTIAAELRRYRDLQASLPVLDFAFGWLLRNAPPEVPPVVLHGDFRMGNLMIDSTGISAVLDWELAHLGDPAQDLAYLCVPSWRHGHYDKPVGGVGQIDTLLAAYRQFSGREIERERFRFWLVYGTLFWGVVCLSMGQLWRSGGDRSLERLVIGRRVSEVELDLLLLFEDELGLQGRDRLDWLPPAAAAEYSGEIAYSELAVALAEWNKNSVQPEARNHQLFESRVAGNALGILTRQLQWGRAFEDGQSKRLAALGLDHREFCQGLHSGRIELSEQRVWDHLRRTALEREVVDQPKHAGLRLALQRWC